MRPSDYIKKGWCQGASAVDEQGVVVDPRSPQAARWCLTGAIIAAYPEDIHQREMVSDSLAKTPASLMAHWNDTHGRTQKEVIEVLESIGE